MAELSGKQALVSYGGGFVAAMDEWDLTANNNLLDVTTFSTGTVQWRDFIPGLAPFRATSTQRRQVSTICERTR
jgi:hypothetical protein